MTIELLNQNSKIYRGNIQKNFVFNKLLLYLFKGKEYNN